MGQRAFKQLTARDRQLIATLRTQKPKEPRPSISEIARRIGKHKSTVSRELRRHQGIETPQDRFFWLRIQKYWSEEELDEYLKTRPAEERRSSTYWCPKSAQSQSDWKRWRAIQKRRRKKPATRKWVVAKLRLGWSPQQIAGRSKIDGPESVSHEYIYSLLHRYKKRGGRLYRLLKRFGKRKQRLGGRTYSPPPVAGRVGIEQRPAIVDKRSRLGDCEADLIVGYRQSGYILSVLDRKSRRAVLRRLKTKRMQSVRKQIEAALRQLGHAHTLTVDNGKEFYDHRMLTSTTGLRVYFTHPYCASEHGAIENFNGLVRHYLPKRTSFAKLTQAQLRKFQNLLNHRPRKCLGYLTPHEVHFKKRPLRQRASHVAFEG